MNMIQSAKDQVAALTRAAYEAAAAEGTLPEGVETPVSVEIPKDAANGDYTTTFCLAAACSATRWRACWTGTARTWRASSTSTTPETRSRSSPGVSRRAICSSFTAKTRWTSRRTATMATISARWRRASARAAATTGRTGARRSAAPPWRASDWTATCPG